MSRGAETKAKYMFASGDKDLLRGKQEDRRLFVATKCVPCSGSGKISCAHHGQIVLKACLFCGGRGVDHG